MNPFTPQPRAPRDRPFVTLTFAQSLDSSLALGPGIRTALSGPDTKAMTHYLRSVHDAILVGVGTAIADDPALNCRLEDVAGDVSKQPRPVVLDPHRRWDVETSACLRLAQQGRGKAPWILTGAAGLATGPAEVNYISLSNIQDSDESHAHAFSWPEILKALHERGIQSVMIEGGGSVINSLLSPENASLVDAVIITIAPTWLGQGGVVVSPPRRQAGTAVGRLRDTKWYQMGDDAVLCGFLAEQVT